MREGVAFGALLIFSLFLIVEGARGHMGRYVAITFVPTIVEVT